MLKIWPTVFFYYYNLCLHSHVTCVTHVTIVTNLHYIIILYDFVVIKELLLRTYYIYELPTYNKQEDVVVYSDGYY